MKTTATKQLQTETLQPKANKQAGAQQILQRYKQHSAQLQATEEEELLQGKFETTQLASEEEELLQGKFESTQRMELDEEEPLQGKFETTQLATEEEEPLQRQPNNTGLPDNLKSGIENMSGYSMDDVKVHYNSSQPATLQAHAYAQGTDIHIAPGQEKHLPHEAWHVVQQKQGRVKPTMQMKGTIPVNDDAGLEKEADVMGNKAISQKQSVGKFSIQFIDNKFEVINQRRSQEIVNNSDQTKAFQMSSSEKSILNLSLNSNHKMLQLKPVEANVVGISHLVALRRDGLLEDNYLDNEGALLNDKDRLTIDDERIHMSRRGPNQEIEPDDEEGPVQYPWYNVLEMNNNKLTGDFFVRADVLKLEDGSTPKLTDDQVNLLDLSMPFYMASQKAYQETLKDVSKSELYSTHRSVGFEFEFGKHNQEGLGSHIVLAKSNNFSSLFDLPFVLETDSGSVLEIGFPPLLFRNRPGGGPNSSAISHIFRKAQTEIGAIGNATEKGVAELCNDLSEKGFGADWKLESGYETLRTKDKSGVNKFGRRGVYSQMNISLSSEESAQLIEVMRHAEKGTAENGVLGSRYEEMISKMNGKSSYNAKIQLAKVYANLFAAFDISRMKDRGIPDRDGFDLASTVKELYGVWVKDSPVNILSPFKGMIDKVDVDAAYLYTKEKLEEDISALKEMIPKPHETIYEQIQKAFGGEYTDGCFDEVLKSDFQGKMGLQNFDKEMKRLLEEGENVQSEEDEVKYKEFYKYHNQTFKPWFDKQQFEAITPVTNATAPIMRELNNMTGWILSNVIVFLGNTEFGKETFGMGLGVRKDTMLSPILDEHRKPMMSVAELRSDYVINKFFENS